LKSEKCLRSAKIILQIFCTLVFSLSLLAAGSIWNSLSGLFASVQAVPLVMRALASAAVPATVLLCAGLAGTKLFGRLYCALICPLGSVMDFALYLNRRRILRHSTPRHALQGSFFLLLVISAGMGFPLLLFAADPYGIFVRGVRVLILPLYALLLSAVNAASRLFGFYGPPSVPLETGIPVVAADTVLFLSVSIAAYFRGRLFCRSLCPVGAVLEFFSFRSLFGIRFETTCSGCRSCERVCPALCLDAVHKKVDSGRCVLCFACLAVCPSSSIRYALTCDKRRKPQNVNTSPRSGDRCDKSVDRRTFLAVAGTGVLAMATPGFVRILDRIHSETGFVTLNGIRRPLSVAPGAVSLVRYSRYCTGCGLCVSRCPSSVLRHFDPFQGHISGFKVGLQPFLEYSRSFCAYDCVVCNQICPTGALLPLSREAKRTVAVGECVFMRSRCIVVTKGTSCGACAEHCPTGAVSMRVMGEGRPTEPFLDTTLCVGCGACEKICPSLPLKAIWVSGLAVHRIARLPHGGGIDPGTDGFAF
jgi:ferredoxin